MEGKLSYKFPTEDGGEIERHFDFGNYALEMSLEEMDASISDLTELLNKKAFRFLRVFIFHAACYPIIKKGDVVNFTSFDIHEWIDSTGGVNGLFMVEVNRVVLKSLGLIETVEEKKSKPNPKK